MVAIRQVPRWTLAEYLDLEEHGGSPIKHEFVDGYVYAMSGGTQAHSLISINVTATFSALLRGGPCRVFNSDMKVQLTPAVFVYPDASVSCDPQDHRNTATSIVAPRVAIEVLSESTANYDRNGVDGKFALYKSCPTMQEYIVIETERRAIDIFRRQDDGTWIGQTYGPEEDMAVISLGLVISVAAFYTDLDISA